MDNFTPSSSERERFYPPLFIYQLSHYFSTAFFSFFFLNLKNVFHLGKLISHIFRDNEVCQDAEWERYFSYTNIEVPEIYTGPRLTFPLDANQAADLVDAFRNNQVGDVPANTYWCAFFCIKIKKRFRLMRFSHTLKCMFSLASSSFILVMFSNFFLKPGSCSEFFPTLTESPHVIAKRSQYVVGKPLHLLYLSYSVCWHFTSLHVSIPLVLGDLHGQLQDLLLIFYKVSFVY